MNIIIKEKNTFNPLSFEAPAQFFLNFSKEELDEGKSLEPKQSNTWCTK